MGNTLAKCTSCFKCNCKSIKCNFCCSRCTRSKEVLTIIHFNDAYEIKETDEENCGGAPRFCTLIESYKNLNPVVLFSGDLWNPSKCNFSHLITSELNFQRRPTC